MRLIELRLKNLNSLKGEWHIDFSDPAFINEGIFAITGQTGAGKTTILDAICLALYGETPRINSISKSSNEVMTRQTGECSAEVVIDLDGEQYRCSWGQRRAYNKPDGKLQDATHEIAKINRDKDTADGPDQILESKLSRTKDKIIELTRMDFQQFTRSILLAQGSFSAFLKAKADERADILEKITGTNIYATISERVFATKRDEEAKLNQLQAGLDGLALLSPENEQKLQVERQALRQDSDSQSNELKTIEEQLKWLDSITELKTNIAQYQADLTQAQQAKADFEADNERLDKANQALEIASSFEKLSHTRQSVTKWQQEEQAITKQLPLEQANIEATVSALQQTQQLAVQAETTLEQTLPTIAKTRQLDTSISQSETALIEDKQRREQQSDIIGRLNHDITADSQSRLTTEQQLTDATVYLDEHQHFVNLDTDIANIDGTCQQIKSLLLDNSELATARLTAQSELKQHQAKGDELSDQLTISQQQLASQQQALIDAEQRQQRLLGKLNLKEIREQQDKIDDSSARFDHLNQKLRELRERTSQLNVILETLPKVQTDLTAIGQRIAATSQELTVAKSQRQDKQTHLNLLQRVAKLEDYIDQLESGSPCPLCGATEHPYAQQHPLRGETAEPQSKIGQTEQEINQLDQKIEALDHQLAAARIEQATEQNDQSRLLADGQSLYEQAHILTGDIADITAAGEFISQVDELIHSPIDKSAELSTDHCPEQAIETLPLTPLNQVLAKLKQTFANANPDTLSNFSNLSNSTAPADLLDLSSQINNVTASIESGLSHSQAVKQSLQQRKLTLKQIITDYEAATTHIDAIEKQCAQLERSAQALTHQISEVNTEQKLTQQRLESIDKDISSNFNDLNELSTTLSQLIHQYQQDVDAQHSGQSLTPCSMTAYQTLNKSLEAQQILSSDDIEHCFKFFRHYRSTLKSLKSHYDAQITAKQTLDTLISNLNVQIKANQVQLNEAQQALTALDKQIQDRSAQSASFKQQRQALFATKKPDEEESRLRNTVDEAKTKLNNTQRQHDAAQQRIKQLLDNKQTINEQLISVVETLALQESSFKQQLADLGFADEQSFIAASLTKADRDILSEQKQKISNDLQRAQSLLSQSERLLSDKLANPLTDQSREDIATRQQHLQNVIQSLSEQIGAINQQLSDNEDLKKRNQSQQLAIDAQKKQLKIWKELSDLIGSADGKKFRTFAQGLTFQIMVSHANTKLQKMSDRYLLIRDDDSPLELNVIDNYQGGEVRSTKNLSGGEGFIISLALALGLSQMASHNIRVDSLFLDEGFGTLDEDSLDIALDTLTSLQQEGKLIGVISHVQALKERILTQIKVEKISGGHSILTGTGCQKIAD